MSPPDVSMKMCQPKDTLKAYVLLIALRLLADTGLTYEAMQAEWPVLMDTEFVTQFEVIRHGQHSSKTSMAIYKATTIALLSAMKINIEETDACAPHWNHQTTEVSKQQLIRYTSTS